MNNQNKIIGKVRLGLLVMISATGNYLYSQCLTLHNNCNYQASTGSALTCQGSLSGVQPPVEGDSPRDLPGFSPCGMAYVLGIPLNQPCGFVSGGQCS